MDKIIPSFYQRYGRMVNLARAIPLAIDGLKPVERRVLLSTYEIARDKFTKCAKIDGYCIGNYHPHGSVYGTVTLFVHQGFLDGQGNFGTDIGVDDCPPAAMRYTEAKLNKEMDNMAFKLIKYVPWIEGEMAGDKEPAYLPTMFPVCLLGKYYSSGIGFGYKTLIPSYKKEDLYKRLLWLLGKEKTKPIIKPISDCDILASEAELDQLLSTGKASIKIKGKYTLEPHLNKLILHSWPPGRKFEGLLGKFASELNSSDIGFQDLSAQDQTRVVFEVLKQRSRDVIYKDFIKKMDTTIVGTISFETLGVNVDKDGKAFVSPMSVDSMLLNTYTMFKDVNKVMLEEERKNTFFQIDEYKALEKIRPELSNELRNKNIIIDESIKKISTKTLVPEETIRSLIGKYRISKLLSLSLDITDLENKIKDYDNKLKKLDEFVLNQYGDK